MKRISIIKGFTLVELLVTISIFVILAFIAIPSFTNLLKSQESKQICNEIRSILLNARSMAFTSKNFVVVCPTANQTQCTKNHPSAFISFIDKNQNNRFDHQDELLSKISIKLQYGYLKFGFGGRKTYLKFSPETGKPIGSQGNITYCDKHHDRKRNRSVIMSEHGVARLSADSNLDGIHENSQNRPISC